MVDMSILQNIRAVIENILGSGIAINGQISFNGLTITSVDKARDLGVLPGKPQQQGNQPQEKSGQRSQEQSSQQKGKQDQQPQQGTQISREEFNSLMEEVKYMRKLMESSQQEPPSQKGQSSQSK